MSGVSLNRDYPLGDDRTKMIAAGLVVGDADLNATLDAVISALGAPEYQQFDAGKGLAVGVFYRSRDSVQQIVISADEPLLAHSDYAKPIGTNAAEELFGEIIPGSAKIDNPPMGVHCTGAFCRKYELHGQMFISRNFVNDDMISISASWSQQ